MTPGLRKLALTAHISCSVGWLGAVCGFLALALVGLTSHDVERTRGAYLAMGMITWAVIVPLAFASLATGIISSLGTVWGLFRHYWVIFKLLITAFSTAVLMVHTRPIDTLASAAARGAFDAALRGPQQMMVTASAAAIGALVVVTVLSVYKPRGTPAIGSKLP